MDTSRDYQVTPFRAHLFRFLFQRSVCVRCILRVQLEQSFSLYRESARYPDILRLLDTALGTSMITQYDPDTLKLHAANPLCQLCLGIIQLAESQSKTIAQQVLAEEWEFQSYKLTLNVPYSCQIRQRSLIEVFRREQGEEFKEEEDYQSMIVQWKSNYLDLKYIYKWVIAPVLTIDLDCKSLVDNKFIIDLFFRHDQDEHAFFRLFNRTIQ